MFNEFSEEDIRKLKELVESSETETFMVGHILNHSLNNTDNPNKEKE